MTVGIDLVRVSRITESLANFGERFLRRVFTDGEIAYATATPDLAAERLAARFAAKEAAFKALGLADHGNWRDIEVTRAPSGACALSLHGATRDAANEAGVVDLAVSLSHEGDYATAVVLATRNQEAAQP
jgi:holo-[acyl-carrier protein] synthase